MSFRSPGRACVAIGLSLTLALLTACGSNNDSTSTTTELTLTAATAVLGQSGFTTATANRGGAADANTLSQPLGGAAGTSGSSFFVADYGDSRILGYNSAPTITNSAANFVIGQDDFVSSLPSGGANRLALPGAVWVGGGRLVVADTGNNRVLIWNTLPTGNTAPDVIVGQPDLNSNGPGLSAAALNSPVAAAIAGNRLFVVDQNNNRVLVWNTIPTANATTADLVIGQSDFVSGIGATTQNRLLQPSGIWTDGFRLLIADGGNNRVMYWTSIPSTNAANASFVVGQATFTFSSTAPSAQTMNTPVGIASDGTRLFVADSGNNRVLVFNSFPIANNTAADSVLGQDSFTRNTANDDNGNATNPQDGTSEGVPTARTLSRPTGVFYLGGNLYVTDRGNNRVLLFRE